MGILLVCMSTHHVYAWCPRRPEMGVGSSGTGGIGSCVSPCRCWELNLDPWENSASAFNHWVITLAPKWLFKLYIEKAHNPLFKWNEKRGAFQDVLFGICTLENKQLLSLQINESWETWSKSGRSEDWSSHFFLNEPWQLALRATSKHPWTQALSSSLEGREEGLCIVKQRCCCLFKSRHEHSQTGFLTSWWLQLILVSTDIQGTQRPETWPFD